MVLLLILFLWRPGVYQLRNRIAHSIGRALGRRVALDNVSLRFLPRPGFDLEGLVVYDDPAFSAEPMIRAQEVSAAIRFRSLLRGRLEIATLSASEPSINLVRSSEGRWNLSSLLERNAQIPAAPTGKPASERRPAFPYLEASNARINFKIGQTKKSYALMDADVALWQDSENSWGARMRAEPVRTDFNLTDTGLLQINATWQRASSLQSTPVQLAVQWRNGQLGQITKLLSGKDRGWRGGVNFTASLSGTPEALRIESQTVVEDFHHYDIAGPENVRLSTSCSGQYDAVTRALDNLLCESPVGGGTLRLSGIIAESAHLPTYDLTLAAEKVPLGSVVRLLRQAKKEIPGDLTANGLLNAEFRTTRSVPGAAQNGVQRPSQTWAGNGSLSNVRLASNAGKDEVSFGTIPVSLMAADAQGGRPVLLRTSRGKTGDPERDQEPAEPHLRIGPVLLAMSASPVASAGGWISSAGYRFYLRGDIELKDLFRLENVLGLPVARPAVEGSAKLDASFSGPWQGFAGPIAVGTAQLRNVRAETLGLNTPIEIASASATLTPDEVLLQKISARTGGTHWSGGVTVPRHCAAPSPKTAPGGATNGASNIASNVASKMTPNCAFQFDLTADEFSTEDLAEWFTPQSAKRPWYRILNSTVDSGVSPLLAIQARGILHVGEFGLKRVLVIEVATQVEVDRGEITLTGLRGQLLQGTHQGKWTIDLSNHDVSNHDSSGRDTSSQGVHYHGTGKLQNISLAQVGALMNDDWISGTADGNFDLDGLGDNFRDLLAHSDARLHFVMRNGSLPHIEIPGSPMPLPVHRFTGELRLQKGAWQLSAGKLETRDGIYRVDGTASPRFNFVMTRGDEQSWTVTGTLARPRVEPAGRSDRTEATAKTVNP